MDFGFNLKSVTQLLSANALLSGWGSAGSEQHSKCAALKQTLRIENTTIVDARFLAAGSRVKVGKLCPEQQSQKFYAPTSLCRVQFVTKTSESSGIRAEAWLPEEWYGRFMGVGNGGLGGCIGYDDLSYGSSFHFASVGSNNGHDGNSGEDFLNNPEVIEDFAHRSIHVEAVVGKQIVEAYYGHQHQKSYYLGCSTGGRQGTQEALRYPADFDGIIAGAPATDFNHLIHWTGMLSRHTGAPDPTSPAFLSASEWDLVSKEILKQCDALDGVEDGIITEPDTCLFRPEALICRPGQIDDCLFPAQIAALRKIYSPLYSDGKLIYPRFDPGAELTYRQFIWGGQFPEYPRDWLQYVVLNHTTFDFSKYGPKQGKRIEAINAGGIATFSGDLAAFRDRGGKFLTYHGRMDGLIASGNSKRMYDLVSATLSMPSLDSFYRLFLVPGLAHCTGGIGSPNFGQRSYDVTHGVNASSHNLLLALVDWVENGKAPDEMIGTSYDGQTERAHCRYPFRSVRNAEQTAWICVQ
ncbi:unnamed protein product [Mycena citricolor]|uniref:Carboxylic ester hydrolase n=1 Tax=Mycena citricolor TaxID=2018698 RepID=A0AAD2K0N5_9AGAR|nr:unnamed protein product [Mycena citricolor]